MSEALKNNEDNQPNEDSSFATLQDEKSFEEHMEELEANKQKTVVRSGEVTKVFKDQDGKISIESGYVGPYYSYEKSEGHDRHNPEDMKFGQAIWDVGFAAALLDIDEDVARQLSENGYIDQDTLSPVSLRQFNKIWNGLLAMASSIKNTSEAGKAIEQIRKTGRVGEWISDLFDTIIEMNESGYNLGLIKDEQVTDSSQFELLERQFDELQSGREIDPEAVSDLYAKYCELAKTSFDPETTKKINDRIKYLASLTDRLEHINKKIASFDD